MTQRAEENPDNTPLRERPIAEICQTLQEVLGQRIVSASVAKKDPRIVGRFALAIEQPDETTEGRLRDLAEFVEIRRGYECEESLRGTMLGSNPRLADGQAPIELLINGESERLLAAAHQL